MKKVILSIFAISLICANASFATSQNSNNNAKSRVQKARKEKARCQAMQDAAQKEECLAALEEKAAKKEADSKEKK